MKSSQAFFGGIKQDVEKHFNGAMLSSCLNVSVSDMSIRKRTGFQMLCSFGNENEFFPTSLSFINLPEHGYTGHIDCYILSGNDVTDSINQHFSVRL